MTDTPEAAHIRLLLELQRTLNVVHDAVRDARHTIAVSKDLIHDSHDVIAEADALLTGSGRLAVRLAEPSMLRRRRSGR